MTSTGGDSKVICYRRDHAAADLWWTYSMRMSAIHSGPDAVGGSPRLWSARPEFGHVVGEFQGKAIGKLAIRIPLNRSSNSPVVFLEKPNGTNGHDHLWIFNRYAGSEQLSPLIQHPGDFRHLRRQAEIDVLRGIFCREAPYTQRCLERPQQASVRAAFVVIMHTMQDRARKCTACQVS